MPESTFARCCTTGHSGWIPQQNPSACLAFGGRTVCISPPVSEQLVEMPFLFSFFATLSLSWCCLSAECVPVPGSRELWGRGCVSPCSGAQVQSRSLGETTWEVPKGSLRPGRGLDNSAVPPAPRSTFPVLACGSWGGPGSCVSKASPSTVSHTCCPSCHHLSSWCGQNLTRGPPLRTPFRKCLEVFWEEDKGLLLSFKVGGVVFCQLGRSLQQEESFSKMCL